MQMKELSHWEQLLHHVVDLPTCNSKKYVSKLNILPVLYFNCQKKKKLSETVLTYK